MSWPFSNVAQPNVDPNLGPVPQSPAAVETVDVWLMGCTFVNTSGSARTVTLTDTAGVALLSAVEVPSSGISFEKEWPFVRLLGLKWSASGSGVTGKYWGYK